MDSDGKIPEIFNHPGLSKDAKPLRVMSKAEWFKIRVQDSKPNHLSKLVHRDDKRPKMSLNCRVKIYGIKDSKVTWVNIKEAVKKIAEPTFIDYRPGESEGILQFGSEKERENFMKDTKEHKIWINDRQVKFEELSKSEEERYLMKSMRNKRRSFGPDRSRRFKK